MSAIKKLRCVVIEDEPADLKWLVEKLSEFEELEIVGEADSVLRAVDLIANTAPDAAFMDIKLIGGDAFAVLKRLKEKGFPIPYVVITTGYSDYSVRTINDFSGYLVKYIMKPFVDDHDIIFLDAVEALQIACSDHNASNIITALQQEDFIFVRNRETMTRISFADIRYIEVEGDGKVAIVTDKTSVILDLTMSKCLEKLPRYIHRVSRDFAVNIQYIQGINKTDRTLQLDVNMPDFTIGEDYYKNLMRLLPVF
jgi:DNA-binding LytR/AlgR family response regulator